MVKNVVLPHFNDFGILFNLQIKFYKEIALKFYQIGFEENN